MEQNDGAGRRRRSRRSGTVVVEFDGHPHRIDLGAIERAFFRQVVAGKYESRAGLAEAVGLSRSTVARFASGQGSSLVVALKILAALELRFDDVATPCDAE
jgi:hypothetical protein